MRLFKYLSIILAVILILPVVVLNILSPEDHSSDYPEDRLLIERFNSERDRFEKLKAGDQSETVKTALQIDRIESSRYTVWFQDIVATGYCAKGYLFSESTPGQIVENIDDAVFKESPRPCTSRQLEIYRKIGDGWYLFYVAVN
jgi:hypothetical protein